MTSARKAPPPDDPEPMDEVEQYRMPLLDHLRELRDRLLYALAALVIGVCISLAFVDDILHFATAPVKEALAKAGVEGSLALVNSPFEGMQVWMHAALIGGITLASPVIAWQVWAFVAPGLYQTERKFVAPLALSSTALFIGGGAFAYWVIFPIAFPFFFTVVDAEVSLSIQGYLDAVLKLIIAFGASFQLPIATFFLARMGLIDARDMIRGFRYSVVAIFAVAAVITPPDVLSQSLLAAPLMVLYFVSVFVAWLFSTKQRTAD
jgi:sec-independent protein translocase protein TatC